MWAGHPPNKLFFFGDILRMRFTRQFDILTLPGMTSGEEISAQAGQIYDPLSDYGRHARPCSRCQWYPIPWRRKSNASRII